MREVINYMIEANAALLIFLVFYKMVLERETSFRFMRFFVLAAIAISIFFPLMHFQSVQELSIPSISKVVPEYWLPEIVISGPGEVQTTEAANTAQDVWQIATWIYATGVILFLAWLIAQLMTFLLTIRKADAYKVSRFKVIESAEDKPTFSFFNIIYIGRAHELSATEKQQIIIHESVHARQWHSLDILLVTMLQILFWFNPFIKIYKKIFIQLHEFEADARAVENADVNKYCNLLAKVALQEAHFPIASHFNHSLTIKRIEMMRTIKKKISRWKVAAIAMIIPVTFFIIACQDQVNEIAQSTVIQTSDYPAEVKADMDQYMKKHPGAKLTYMEGLPDEVDKMLDAPQVKDKVVDIYNLNKDEGLKKGVLLSDIVQYAEKLQTEDKVFMVVEQQPEFPGGFNALKNFVAENLKYPEAAAAAKITGVVYISFIINTDGSVSDTKVLMGVEPSLDQEALRVVRMFPNWIPGRQNGNAVRVRFNIPIKYSAGHKQFEGAEGALELSIVPDNYQLKISPRITRVNGKTVFEGTVTDENGKALPSATILIAGTTTGTKTDANGNYKLETTQEKGQLVFSFIGFDTKTIDF